MLAPALARAQAPDAGRGAIESSGIEDPIDWTAEPGRPGWNPDLWAGGGPPWSFAGLARGGWTLARDGRPPGMRPFPGALTVREPLAWSDTVGVAPTPGSAWEGFDGGLAGVTTSARVGAPRTRAVVNVGTGDSGFEENGLTVARGDSLTTVAGEAWTAQRGVYGALEAQGRHLWSAAGAAIRGKEQWSGAFVQRGGAARVHGGEEETSNGQAVELHYTHVAAEWHAGGTIGRAYDGHESFGGPLPYSRRDAGETWLALGAGRRALGGDLELRAEASRTRIRRSADPVFDRSADAGWLAARLSRSLGPGTLELALGAGHHQATGGAALAPAATWRARIRAIDARVFGGRVVTPVWSDLAAGVAPFTQSTWAGGIDLAATAGKGTRARLTTIVGRSTGRALVPRRPFEELWLRADSAGGGVARDSMPYPFLLSSGGVDWTAGPWSAGLEGYALLRHDSALQPRLDPNAGADAYVAARGSAFQGDLGLYLRLECGAVAARESEVAPPASAGAGSARTLAGFATYGASAMLTLGDAHLVVRARNLEAKRREETWFDSDTGTLARGPGRRIEARLIWKLFN